jgi:hypothetical protein
MEVTKLDDLKKFNDGEIVELPAFDDNTPFVAKLKRPSLLALCKAGAIPNQLLGAAQEIFEGRQKSNIKNYADVLDVIISQALIEPAYEDVKEYLTDMQRMAIFAYTQNGIKGLLPFREIERISKDSTLGKK